MLYYNVNRTDSDRTDHLCGLGSYMSRGLFAASEQAMFRIVSGSCTVVTHFWQKTCLFVLCFIELHRQRGSRKPICGALVPLSYSSDTPGTYLRAAELYSDFTGQRNNDVFMTNDSH